MAGAAPGFGKWSCSDIHSFFYFHFLPSLNFYLSIRSERPISHPQLDKEGTRTTANGQARRDLITKFRVLLFRSSRILNHSITFSKNFNVSSFAHHLFVAGTGLELLNFQYCPGSGPFDPASGKEGKAYVKLFIQITRLCLAEVKLSPFQMPCAGGKTKTPIRPFGPTKISPLRGSWEFFTTEERISDLRNLI